MYLLILQVILCPEPEQVRFRVYKMRKFIFTITSILFIVATATVQPTFALNRDALVAAARAGTGITNAYNINTIIINTAGSNINGAPIPSNSLATLSTALAKVQILKNRLLNLH